MKHLLILSVFAGLVMDSTAAPAPRVVDSPLTAEQSLAAFQVEAGLRVEIAAAEPITVDPVAVAFDEMGRMFVAENAGYPTGPEAGKPGEGVIALLEDLNGDGRYDKRTLYAQGLTFPNGLMPWKGGLIVTCAPDIYYYMDTDGDGKADVRRVLLTGFTTTTTTQLRVSHPTLGIDGWIYLTSGLTGGKITSPEHPERPAVEITKGDSRFNPDTMEFETNPGAAQFGLTFDDFGRKFVCSNRNPLQQAVMLPRYLKRNPFLAFSETMQEVSPFGDAAKVYPLSQDTTTASYMPGLMAAPHAGTFTSACGITIYRGTALPPAMYGSAFVCEPAQNVVQRQVLSPNGATFASRAAQSGKEFLASPDGWFRPVFAANGPDGGLYICDMYRKTIDHPQYLPEAIRATADFTSGKYMGRIYRVVSEKQPKGKVKKVALGKESAKGLVSELNHPNGWQRDTAHRLLLEKNDKAAAAALQSMVRGGRSGLATARATALRTLESFGVTDEALIKTALADPSPGVREHAIQLAEPRLAPSPALYDAVLALANDPDARVRFQCALTLGEMDDPRVIPALALIALRGPEDRWTKAAALSAVGKRSEEFFAAILAQAGKAAVPSPALMQDLGQVLAASQPPATLGRQIARMTESKEPKDFAWQLAGLSGMANGLRARGQAAKGGLVGVAAQDPVAAARVSETFQAALKIAQDSTQATTNRTVALGFLAHADYATAGKPLQGLIGLREPAEVQVAAVRALGQMGEPAIGTDLVNRERWRSYSPGVREAVTATLLAQPKLVPALLGAIEKGDVPAWAVDPARRTQLLKHRDEAVRKRAEAAFASLQSGDRMKTYEEYKAVLGLKADGKNGHAVFTKLCASCHVYAGEGARVGPELTGVRNQPAEALLLHIIVPDYEIVAGFTSYEIETKDGRSLSGLLASETATSVTLRRALAEEENILRSNISTMSSTSLSLMPQELEKSVSKQDIADLIAFLKGQ